MQRRRWLSHIIRGLRKLSRLKISKMGRNQKEERIASVSEEERV